MPLAGKRDCPVGESKISLPLLSQKAKGKGRSLRLIDGAAAKCRVYVRAPASNNNIPTYSYYVETMRAAGFSLPPPNCGSPAVTFEPSSACVARRSRRPGPAPRPRCGGLHNKFLWDSPPISYLLSPGGRRDQAARDRRRCHLRKEMHRGGGSPLGVLDKSSM